MEQLFSDLEKTMNVSAHGDYIHLITENGDKIIKVSDFIKEIQASALDMQKIGELEKKIEELEARPQFFVGTEEEIKKLCEDGSVRVGDLTISTGSDENDENNENDENPETSAETGQ